MGRPNNNSRDSRQSWEDQKSRAAIRGNHGKTKNHEPRSAAIMGKQKISSRDLRQSWEDQLTIAAIRGNHGKT
jgi:predicted NAD-dependent protein-ADP-ribosyltransferase YbiA (DUF1768 family)